MATEGAKNPIKTTRTSFRILRTLAETGGASLGRLEADLDITKGAIYNHLATLEALGFVYERENTYYLGFALLEFVEPTRARSPLGGAAVGPLVSRRVCELADAAGESVSVVVREGNGAHVIYTAAADRRSPGRATLGSEVPLFTSAPGRAILSKLPDEEIERLHDATEPPEPIDRLMEGITKVRAQGIAVDRGEHVDGVHGVATPITGTGDEVLGAIAVSGPADRLSGKALQQDIAGLALRAAKDIAKAVER